jgi:hypothetical protein
MDRNRNSLGGAPLGGLQVGSVSREESPGVEHL